jgi:hypothetical protein
MEAAPQDAKSNDSTDPDRPRSLPDLEECDTDHEIETQPRGPNRWARGPYEFSYEGVVYLIDCAGIMSQTEKREVFVGLRATKDSEEYRGP